MSGHGRIGIIHIHSDYSRDGLDSLEHLREWGLERGIHFIGLADHAEDFDEELFEAYSVRCRDLSDERLRLISGLEFRFAGYTGLHLLALDLSRWIAPRTPQEFLTQTRGAAGLTVLAHPVLSRYRIPDAVLNGIDAVEVWNASYNTRFLPDPRAIRLLHTLRERRPEVVGTAGLDQHDSRNDREVRVMVHQVSADPIAELKAGRFTNIGRTMQFNSAVGWSPLRLRALSATRWAFDRVERTQERLARARARARQLERRDTSSARGHAPPSEQTVASRD
jgi:hypothetical protein